MSFCDVDFEHEGSHKEFRAEIVKITDQGVLIHCNARQAKHSRIFDFVRLTLYISNGMSISVGGQIIRIEAHTSEEVISSDDILLAVKFTSPEMIFRDILERYLPFDHEECSGLT